ncbi:MAG: sodium ion-translocating decarboxylase subunit beta [Ruthenibacterium sp.]
MTQEQKDIKRYATQIEKRLCLPRKEKARVNGDIGTDIHARMEAGQSFAQVKAEMGTPQEVAAALNETMTGHCVMFHKNPWRWAFVGVGALAVLWCVVFLMHAGIALFYTPPSAESVGIIGAADGPTSIFVTTSHSDSLPWQGLALAAPLILVCAAGYLLVKWGKDGAQRGYQRAGGLALAALAVSAVALALHTVQFVSMCQTVLHAQVTLPTFSPGISWLSVLLAFGSVGLLPQLLSPGTWLSVIFLVMAVRRKRAAAARDAQNAQNAAEKASLPPEEGKPE